MSGANLGKQMEEEAGQAVGAPQRESRYGGRRGWVRKAEGGGLDGKGGLLLFCLFWYAGAGGEYLVSGGSQGQPWPGVCNPNPDS
jgi:hypothetical protein